MSQLLKPHQKIHLDTSGLNGHVEFLLGEGGQGEVYQAMVGNKRVALKWYYPQQATPEQRTALELIMQHGAPTNQFLWPLELAFVRGIEGFGYIMPLRPLRYKSIIDLMKQTIDPPFEVIITAGIELAHNFLQLHAKGLCYRDISFGNLFFDPRTGDILICDNDNVTVDGEAKINVLGTPRFMAPEIVRGEAVPSIQTDLYSLAVLLFYMLMVHHPLEGEQELKIKCLDLPAMNRIYGTNPIFIFDPQNDTNRPVAGYHDNALIYWQIYPQFLRELFVKAFTTGIHDPQQGRVRESEWRTALIQLRNAIVYCSHCDAENFYDSTAPKDNICWSCQQSYQLPYRLHVNHQTIMLNPDSYLFPHHIDPTKPYDFSQPVAIVNRHPQHPNISGLKNLSDHKWQVIIPQSHVLRNVEPGQSVKLALGTKINFGKIKGIVEWNEKRF